MSNKIQRLEIAPVGLVRQSPLKPSVVITEVFDMWNVHIPKLLAKDYYGPLAEGHFGMAETVCDYSLKSVESELQNRGWKYAPPALILGISASTETWILLDVIDKPFTILDRWKEFDAGRPSFFPWAMKVERVVAFGLTPSLDVVTDTGDVKKGIRFPVVRRRS